MGTLYMTINLTSSIYLYTDLTTDIRTSKIAWTDVYDLFLSNAIDIIIAPAAQIPAA